MIVKRALRQFSMKKIAFVWRPAWFALAAFAGGRSVLGADPVFDCHFNDSSCLSSWSQHYGTWTVAGGHLSTTGFPGYSSSISYDADFSGTLDYTVVMRRSGGDTSSNRVYIRGVPEPLSESDKMWHSGYLFQYTKQGEISVYRTLNGTSTALQAWTSNFAVHTGIAWNTLRVAAEGGDLNYYINGTLVWSGTDFTFGTGRVGIGMYVPPGGSGDSLEVDSAVLYGELLPSPVSEPTPSARADSGDYDGDGTSDIAIFRGSSGMWSVRNLTRVYFGNSTDVLVPADYDGDGTSEIAIFRAGGGMWSVRNLSRFYLGGTDDRPVPGDYTGDGTAEAGIFRPASGLWSIRNVTRAFLGSAGDTVIPGYYDGAGAKQIAIFRGSSGMWSVLALTRFYFGASTDGLVPGDYSGAGRWEAGIFREATGLWSIRNATRIYLGSAGDWAVPADYNGDGVDEAAIFRDSAGMWSVRNLTRVYFGGTGDVPVTR